MTVRPIHDDVLLLENPVPAVTNGVIVDRGPWSPFLDYVVFAAPPDAQFGVGDRVVLNCTETGRKTMMDGIPCRLAPLSNVIAVVEDL